MVDTKVFGLLMISGRQTCELVVKSMADVDVTYSLRLGPWLAGDVTFPAGYVPGIAIHGAIAFLWAGSSLFVADLSASILSSYRLPDEITAIYQDNDVWLVIGETSLLSLDLVTRSVLAQSFHDEPILRSWSVDGVLYVEDLTLKQFVVSTQDLTLVPSPKDPRAT